MRVILTLTFLIGTCLLPTLSYAQQLEGITIEGGPIATKHFQGSDEDFRERHGLGILKFHTKDYGNWALYYLAPNSVDDPSFGAGYVTNPYTIGLGQTRLEFTAALGLVTGYQDYPVPLLAGQMRWVLFDNGQWDAGVAIAANPYIIENDDTGDNDFGIVVTSPFLSVGYKF